MKYCVLITRTGEEDSFIELDLFQEQSNKDLKVRQYIPCQSYIVSLRVLQDTYAPNGSNASWEYIKKNSPAIPWLKRLADIVEKAYSALSRGSKHSPPSKDKDIDNLISSFMNDDVHRRQEGREAVMNAKQEPADLVDLGAQALLKPDGLKEWFDRRSFPRSQVNEWEDDEGADAEGQAVVAEEQVDDVLGEGSSDRDAFEDPVLDAQLSMLTMQQLRELGALNEDAMGSM